MNFKRKRNLINDAHQSHKTLSLDVDVVWSRLVLSSGDLLNGFKTFLFVLGALLDFYWWQLLLQFTFYASSSFFYNK